MACGITLAIRNTMYAPPSDVVVVDMIGEEVGRVCNSDYLSRLSPISPDSLASARILGTATRKEAWNEWLSAIGRRDLSVQVHEEYEHFYLMLQAASFGAGIAIAPRYLVGRELATGQLVAPYGFEPVKSRNAER